LLTIAKGELAAEALYYDAILNMEVWGFKYSSSKNWQKLFRLPIFWFKGLILMAKNFYGLKDSFQATYILDNVIENFTDFQMWYPSEKELMPLKRKSLTNSSIVK
jgi:hypothetical protein